MLQFKKNDFLLVIPARYNSSRFPGKPLAKINSKTMLQMVWEKCVKAVGEVNVLIATDDERIGNHCKLNNMHFSLTSKKCLTGTDRLIEIANKIKRKFYINVQGDEPLVKPTDIKKIIRESFKNPKLIINGMCQITNKDEFTNLNVPKLVTNKDNYLLYMSRASIPANKKNKFTRAYKQVCIYSFPRNVLKSKKILNKKTSLEKIEDIEILRFLENGFKIKMIELSRDSIAVDTPSDLRKVISFLNQ